MLEIFATGAVFAFHNNNYFVNQTAAASVITSNTANITERIPAIPLPQPPPKKLANPPEIIKAVYVTGW